MQRIITMQRIRYITATSITAIQSFNGRQRMPRTKFDTSESSERSPDCSDDEEDEVSVQPTNRQRHSLSSSSDDELQAGPSNSIEDELRTKVTKDMSCSVRRKRKYDGKDRTGNIAFRMNAALNLHSISILLSIITHWVSKTYSISCYNCTTRVNAPMQYRCNGSLSPTTDTSNGTKCDYCYRMDEVLSLTNTPKTIPPFHTTFGCVTKEGIKKLDKQVADSNDVAATNRADAGMTVNYCSSGPKCFSVVQGAYESGVKCHECYDLQVGTKSDTDLPASSKPCSERPRKVVRYVQSGDKCKYCTTYKRNMSTPKKVEYTFYSCASENTYDADKVKVVAQNNFHRRNSSVFKASIEGCRSDFCNNTAFIKPNLSAVFSFILCAVVSMSLVS